MHIVFSLFTGLLFGLGLLISGMSNPQKVLSFLDIAGAWDPSLMFVMAGAIAVGLIPFRLAANKEKSFLGTPMPSLCKTQIDWKLLLGSALFGTGWGLAGICPGPAITLLGAGLFEGLVFVLAMLAGMLVFQLFNAKSLQ